MRLRGVRVRSLGGAAPVTLLFSRGNLFLKTKIYEDAKPADAPLYPRIEKDRIVLIPDATIYAGAAVIRETPAPRDFSVDFEYLTKNAASSDPYQTGNGLVFMFLKDAAPYSDRILPIGEQKAFIPGSGYGVHFNIHGRRNIELRGPDGKVLADSKIRSIPDVYSDGAWRKVRVLVNPTGKRIRVTYEGIEVIDYAGELDTSFQNIGFGASTIATAGERGTAEHAIRNVVLREVRNRRR